MKSTEDIKSRIDIVSYIERYVNLKRAGKNYKACCPFHEDKTPSFMVSPQKQTWRCYGACNDGGDIFSFAMKQHGWTFQEALTELARESNVDVSTYQPPKHKKEQPTLAYYPEQSTESNGDKWQERAHKFLAYAEEMMWSDDDTGRKYLRERGFLDRTIQSYGLGYNPTTLWDDWGIIEDSQVKKVWLPNGIVIPYESGDFANISKIRIRRLDWQKGDKHSKYIVPAGVQNTAFFTRKLRKNDIVVLTEGEFDGLILKQVVSDPHVVAMATGGTGGGRLLSYLAMLALAHQVIVAFDNDNGGQQVSQYWMDALPNAVRKTPTQKDINDMYLAGDDIRQWVYGD
jgi:DNA primase